MSASKLRQDIYRILDQVLETGVPVEIHRAGRVLKITVEEAPAKLDRLVERSYLDVDPESLVHLDWSDEWQP